VVPNGQPAQQPQTNGQAASPAATPPSQSLFFVGGNWSAPFISPIAPGVSGQ
jgi:AsmA protein